VKNKIIWGDCLLELKELKDNSIDSIVTDPPYGLSFMGKKWDYDVPSVDIWKECLRVLKPGGHLLSFSGSRTYHRIAINIEDAGFDIRDQIMWVYGSGFPKSHNIGKAVDKLQGNEREVVGSRKAHDIRGNALMEATVPEYKKEVSQIQIDITKGTSEWEGWGTALKPANEPIVLARKPLSEKTIVENVLKWGTGGINIDGCRVDGKPRMTHSDGNYQSKTKDTKVFGEFGLGYKCPEPQGRFPANLILDETAADMLDEQSGELKSGAGKKNTRNSDGNTFKAHGKNDTEFKGSKGGASRFFYCAKASKSERNKGLEGMDTKFTATMNDGIGKREHNENQPNAYNQNNHPTVKPIKLMQYLTRLVTPKNGTCLDPFIGSGTTAIACKLEGFDYLGIEREADYIKIAESRIKAYQFQEKLNG